jgi:hypothetical protein
MATIELHLTDGSTLTQHGATGDSRNAGHGDIVAGLGQIMAAGEAVNLHDTDNPGRVVVVNSAHIRYAVVTP